MNKGYVFLGIGFELMSLGLVGIYLGGAIDKYMNWNGYATIALILLLLFGWFVHLFVLLKKFEDDDSKTPPQS